MGKRRTLKHSLLGMVILGSSLSASLPAAQESVLFGYSMDGWPVSSSRIVQGEIAGVQGFCAHLWEYLAGEGYALEWQELRFDARFLPFAHKLNGRSGLECGPSSLTPERALALQPADGAFKGVFSQPFALTSTKLLIRSAKLDEFYRNPARIRIGVLQAQDDSALPVTTALIGQLFPSAQFKPLHSRKEAVERLLKPVAAEDAIDAYASDEILLGGIHNNPAEMPPSVRDQYSIEPPLAGFSREEYAIAVYNNPALLDKVNAWLASAEGREAVATMQPPADTFTRALAWLNRTDHLVKARLSLTAAALLGAIGILLFMWRSRRQATLPNQPPQSLANQPTVQPEPTSPTVMADVPTPPALSTPVESTILTPQQLRVALLWADGDPAGVIARKLEIPSHRTVEAHLRAVYQKTNTNNRIALLKYLQEQKSL